MKKFILWTTILIFIGSISMGIQNTYTAEAAFSREGSIKARFALKREKLDEVIVKKKEKIQQSILARIKEQEKIKEEKKKAAEAEKAAQAAETKTANEQAAEVTEQPAAPEATPEPEAVTGPSVYTGASRVVTGASRR